jgi:hypothetical protein
MYPEGHARSTGDLAPLLEHKFRLLAGLGVDEVDELARRFSNLSSKSPREIAALYDFRIRGVER